MIRPLLALLIATSIILFVWQYSRFTERIRPEPIQVIETDALGRYDVRVVTTFDCLGDAFGNPSIEIRFRDRVLINETRLVNAGESLLVRDIPDIKEGLNDFLIKVTPVESGDGSPGGSFSLDPAGSTQRNASSIARAVRVEILRDNRLIAEKLAWSSAAGPFGELVRIQIAEDRHEH